MRFFLLLLITYANLKLAQCLSCWYSSNTLPKELKAHQMTYSSSAQSVYIFGGLTVGNGRSNAIYKWNTSEQDGWFIYTETTPSQNFFSHNSNSVIVGDYVYLIGMFDTWNASQWGRIHKFDINIDSFVDNNNLEQAPYPSYGGCLATNKTHIFMVGGRLSGNALLNKLQIYSIADNTWYAENFTLTDILSGWAYQNCEFVGDTLYVFGGSIGVPSYHTDKYYKYEWNAKWKELGRKTVATTSGASVYNENDGNIYLIGGSYTDVIDTFAVLFETITNSSSMLEALGALEAEIINDKLYIFGGWNGCYEPNGITDVVQICDFSPITHKTAPDTTLSTTNMYFIFVCCILVFMLMFMIIMSFKKLKDKNEEIKENIEGEMTEQNALKEGNDKHVVKGQENDTDKLTEGETKGYDD